MAVVGSPLVVDRLKLFAGANCVQKRSFLFLREDKRNVRNAMS